MPERNKSLELEQRKECNLGNFRILIVDDFQFMGSLLSGMLKEIGIGSTIVVETAKDAQKAINFAAKEHSSSTHIDLALIDWLMPETNGTELIRWIRNKEEEHISFMPIILLSAYTSRKVVEAARDNGANDAMVKPISAESLVSRIVHIINHNRPFVKTDTFFGPDRRRKEIQFAGKNRRKMNPSFVEVNHEDV